MLKRKTTFLIVAIALLIIGTVGFSIAQYIDRQEKQNFAVSDNFFFNLDVADNLEDTTPYYVIGNQINIKISNGNGLNINSTDISYSVIVENSVGTDITSSLVLAGNDGTLTGGVLSTDNISISNISVDTLYIVKISSTAPYTKTLSAKFMLRNIDSTYYTITDNGNYITLDLFVGNVLPTSNLTINYGTNLAPDNTNVLMSSWVNATSGTISHSNLTKNSTYTLTLFEQNVSGDYTKAATSLDLTSVQTITITAN